MSDLSDIVHSMLAILPDVTIRQHINPRARQDVAPPGQRNYPHSIFAGSGGDGMANEEHLKILKQGVDVWKEWREQHAEIRPDLSSANLIRA
jgi:hypothetical protein